MNYQHDANSLWLGTKFSANWTVSVKEGHATETWQPVFGLANLFFFNYLVRRSHRIPFKKDPRREHDMI